MDRVGHRLNEGAQEVCGDISRGFLVQFDEGELGDLVNGHQEIKPAISGLNFGDVDVEVAERVGLQLALARSGALEFEQSGDAVPLQAAVQR